MKTTKIQAILSKKIIFIMLAVSTSSHLFALQYSSVDTIKNVKKNYLTTSVFILSSLIPDDNTFFYELDYGRNLNSNMDIIIGINIYKYAAPMSTPMNDKTKYPGTVTSYGVVFAFQYYYWKNLFIDQIINPLILDYNQSQNNTNDEGFMLLMATRLGFHYDFNIFHNPFFIEIGAEISYWPVNSSVPSEFKALDDSYKTFVFSPAFQFGLKF
ncbi:MAG: hypothetical protein A2W99_00080 [Bacteroidetes bacterium GWF2_33_16]|nr:MAG: hypothetical protein A2X00_02785 [Bacteroidetes bacterium GWE2_32_14]OFY08673.1 MAG: hypothetical protein A2W99_00080 [Bacteroidetes bacterium GWF2_33_16]